MRSVCVAAGVVAFMFIPVAGAVAATGSPERPGDPLVPVSASANGGDNGWGNCGHNSSGGAAHTGANGAGGGNGGYAKTDCIGPTDPGPTDPEPTVSDPGGGGIFIS